MFSKENVKVSIFIAFISIFIYKLIDSPSQIVSHIKGLASFFSPFLIGILLSLLLNPMVMSFEKRLKIPRLFNIFISFIIVTFFLSIGFKLLIPAIANTLITLSNEVPNIIGMISSFLTKFVSQSQDLETLLPHIQENLNAILNKLLDIFSRFSSDMLIYFFSITNLLFDIIMGIILSIYMLYDKEKIGIWFKKVLYSFFNRTKADEIIDFCRVSHDIFYHYIVGKLIDSIIIGILAFIGFKFIISIENSLFLSFIIFITNIIPYFGPFIGAVFPIGMTLVYDPVKALWVAIFLLILQQLDGNLIGPKVMGDQVGLSPLLIITAVLIGGSLFGLVGVFLSIPIAAISKFLLDRYIDKKINIKKG